MPVVHPADVRWLASKSLSPPSPEWNKTYTHCAHLSAESALLPAACIRSGLMGRSRRTACRNGVRTRISDTGLTAQSGFREPRHIVSIETGFFGRAFGWPGGRKCPSSPDALPGIADLFASPHRCPGIRAADIFYLTQALRCWRHSPSTSSRYMGISRTAQNVIATFCRLS